ncbi:neprilysin-like [Rhipicephalus microplus]|uniref:neprilysin-like n=1 Tax=Rhipicephalus microplus TaxID=6941 RepID=UPI003F6A547B
MQFLCRSYVCSWWKPLDRFPELTISTQSDLVVKWIEGFGSMLETGAAVDKSGVGQKVSQFYHSCMARTERTQGDADAFVAFIRTIGFTWPEMPPSGVRAMGIILELNYRFAMPLWFSISVSRSAAQSGLRRLVLKPCCLGRLRFILWRNQQAVNKGLYYDYWVAHYEALLGRKSVSRDRNEINDLAREEAHIAEKLAQLSEVSPSVPLLLRFSDIGSHTKRVSSNDWLSQVNKYIVGNEGGRTFTPQDELLVSDESVLSTIDSLLGWYTREKLIDHLSWQFVQMHAWIVDSTLLEMWGQNYWQIYEPILCARETEVVYRPVVAALYVAQIVTPQQRSQLDGNFTDLRNVAAKMYASSTWFDQASRSVAIEKLGAMSVGLWPLEPFFDQSKLRTMYAKFLNKNVTAISWVRLWISAQETMRNLSGTSLHDATMNMRSALFPFLFDYDYLTNKVDVGVSALAKPLYCPQGTRGMFYGSMAFAFTLSMMKMQDLTGLKLYADGTLVKDGRWSWLSDSTAKTYRQKTECLAGDRVSLSDISAFEVVYAAFSRGMSNSTSLVQISREIDEKRTFYMAICLHSCSVENHRSPTVDCNALMRHSRDFSEAFHCKVGSPMNPFSKCSYF